MNWKIFFLIFFLAIVGVIWGAHLAVEPEVNYDIFQVINFPKVEEKNVAPEPLVLRDLLDMRKELLAASSTFIEINFPEMMLYYYKDGAEFRKYPVLARGNEPVWGGTPVGQYRISNKITQAFAFVEGLYMPYALQIYGKFWIHGVPYFPGGKKVYSVYSHGCVRLKDEDAKALFKITEPGMAILLIDRARDKYAYELSTSSVAVSDLGLVEGENEIASTTIPAQYSSSGIPFPNISAQKYLVADFENDFVFGSKNARDQVSISSLAKLMTGIVVAENVDLRRRIQIEKAMLGRGRQGTSGLEAGKRFRVIELLHPLLIESSDDAAEILSEFMGRDKTIKAMNDKAAAIDMRNTVFAGVSGADKETKSTAQDVYYLSRYLLYNMTPLLKLTRSVKTETFGEISVKISDYKNKNLFYNNANFLGGTVGQGEDGKKNGTFIFKLADKVKKPRYVSIVLLESSALKEDTQKIALWLNKNYDLSLFYSSSTLAAAIEE